MKTIFRTPLYILNTWKLHLGLCTLYIKHMKTNYISPSEKFPWTLIFLINRKLYLINRKLYLINRNLYLINRKLYFINRKLYLINRNLYWINRKLYSINRKLYLINRKLYLLPEPLHHHLPELSSVGIYLLVLAEYATFFHS